MKLDKSTLEKMIKNGLRTVSDDELKKLIELELSKNEEDIDTDFIDLCFALMDVEYSNKKRVVFTKPVKNILIAAAILVLMISAISVVAGTNGKNPIKKIPLINSEETTEEETEDITVSQVTDNEGNNGAYYYSDDEEDRVEYVTVPDLYDLTENVLVESATLNSNFDVVITHGDSFSEEDDECVVVSQFPEPGENVPVGTTLRVTIDLKNNSFAVPDFIGKNKSDIESIEGADMFSIVLISADGSTNYGEKIVSQTPEPGTMLPKGTTIYIVTEPAPTTETDTSTTEE